MGPDSIRNFVGPALGVLGGIVGTVFSLRNTSSPRERRFVIVAAISIWLLIGLIVTVLHFVPSLRSCVWVAIVALAVLGIPIFNRQQERSRLEETRKRTSD